MTHASMWGHALLILAIIVCAGLGHLLPRLAGTVLVVLSLLWLTHDDGAYEDGILHVVSPGHGLVVGDFVGLGGLAVGVYLWLLWFWRRRHGRG